MHDKPETRDMTDHLFEEWLIAQGLAQSSAYLYRLHISRLRAAARRDGWTLANIPSAPLAKLWQALPRSRSARMQAQRALVLWWQWTGRQDPPLGVMRIPTSPRNTCRALEADDAAHLHTVAYGRMDGPGLAVELGLHQALRCNEIATLRWADFSHSMHEVTIWGKGDVIAILPVHPHVRERLNQWRETHAGGVGGIVRAGSTFVFEGRQGAASRAIIYRWIKAVGEEAGVPVAPHVLRHTALAVANDATGNLRAVQAFARHARPETTAGYTRAGRKALLGVLESLSYD